MDHVRRSLKLCVVLLALAVFTVLIGACGGGSGTSPSAAPSTAASAVSTSADLGGYKGPDAQYVTKLAEPSLQSGYAFKVGYL